jgi:hypothetical protein
MNVSETISPIGLAAVTRTYARVINDTANIPITELRLFQPAGCVLSPRYHAISSSVP